MCYHLNVESKIKKDTNTLSYKTETDPQTANQLMITKGKRELEGGINWKIRTDIHTTMYNIDNQQGSTI